MKSQKQKAVCVLLSMSMLLTTPAFAAEQPATTAMIVSQSTTATNQTKPNTFTLSDIQKLAVQKNPSTQIVDISLKLAESTLLSASNTLHDMDSKIQTVNNLVPDTSAATAQLAVLKAQLATIQDSDPNAAAMRSLLGAQIAQMEQSLSSAGATINNSIESLVDNRMAAEKAVDSAQNNVDDTNKNKETVKVKTRYAVTALVISEQQLEQQRDYIQKSYELAIRSQEISALREELGLSTTLESASSYLNASQGAAQLNQNQADLAAVKRQINIMIGRPADAELHIAPLALAETVSQAPTYSDDLYRMVARKSTTLSTLQRDINGYKEDAEDLRATGSTASNQYQALDYQTELKRVSLKEEETALKDSLKKCTSQVSTTGEDVKNKQMAMKQAQETYQNEALKYDLGMISQLALAQSELNVQQAEMAYQGAVYAHHLANMAYQALLAGVLVSA